MLFNRYLDVNSFIFIQIDHNIFVKKLSQKAFKCVIDLDFHPQTFPRCVKYTLMC